MMISNIMRSSGGASHLPEAEDIVSRLIERLGNPARPISACPEPGKFYVRQYGPKYYRAMAVLYDDCESPSADSEHVEGEISQREYNLWDSLYNLISYEDNSNPLLVQGKKIVKQLYTQSTSSSPLPDQNLSDDEVFEISNWMRDSLVPAILGTAKPRQQPTLAMSENGPSRLAQSSASSTNGDIPRILDKWKQFLTNPSNGLPTCHKTATEYLEQFGDSRMHALAALIDLCSLRSKSDISFRRKALKKSFLTLSKTEVFAQVDIYVNQGTLIANELVRLIQNSRYAVEFSESDGPFDVLSKFVDVLLPERGYHSGSLTFVLEGGSSVVPRKRATVERHPRLPSSENQNVRPQRNLVSGYPPSSNLYPTVSNQPRRDIPGPSGIDQGLVSGFHPQWYPTMSDQHENVPGPSGIQLEQVSGLLPHSPQAPTLNAIRASQNQPGSTVEEQYKTISQFLKLTSQSISGFERHRISGRRRVLFSTSLPGEVKIEVSNLGIRLFLQFGSLGSTRIDHLPGGTDFDRQQHIPLSRVLEYIAEEAQKMEASGFGGTVDAFIPVRVAGSAIVQPFNPTQYEIDFEIESNFSTAGPVQQNAGPVDIKDSNQNNGDDLQSGGIYQTSGTQLQVAESGITRNNDLDTVNGRPVARERPSKRQRTQHSASDQEQNLQTTSSGSTSTQRNNEQGR